MKLSDLLAQHPQLDTELDISDEMVLDGIYLFRLISPTGDPGSGRLLIHAAPGTDGIVARGLICAASEINAAEWPVHVCGEDHG